MGHAMEVEKMHRTPLYQCHAELGAKFTPFAGWEMPVLYTGVIEEHRAVRENVGLFDVSHMGEVMVFGPEALQFLQYVTSNDVSKLVPGRAQYSVLTNPKGGAVDDIIVYMMRPNEYLVCVNASNCEKDYRWMLQHHGEFEVTVENASLEYGQIAVQGPRAHELLTKLYNAGSFAVADFPSFSFRECALKLEGKESRTIVARTGYTGEDGFEIFVPSERAADLWRGLMKVGEALGVKAAGLGARDTLRLEACLPLYGHELNDDWNILEAGLGWVVKLDKGDFIGREPIAATKAAGIKRKLVGFEVLDPGIVREGTKIYGGNGAEIGWVTSGTKTPTLNRSIGLIYVPIADAVLGNELFADVRGRKLKIRVEKTPFYKRTK